MSLRKKTKIDKLSKQEKSETIKRLLELQGQKSYISGIEIDLSRHKVDIDHIVSLDLGGVDDEMNWGVVISEENRSKGNKDLQLMTFIYEFRHDNKKYLDKKEDFTFGDALDKFYPKREKIKAKFSENAIKMSFNDNRDVKSFQFPLIKDENDNKIISFIGMLPYTILNHDPTINPRSIVDLEPMIVEFYHRNPQLFPSLATLEIKNEEEGEIKIFDGQHKAAAQLYLRSKNLFTRVFVNVDKTNIKRTNFRAHTSLAQIHFPQLISDKIGHDLFSIEFKNFLNSTDLERESERLFLKKEEIVPEYKNYLKNWLKYRILIGEDGEKHKILDFVETVTARSKTYPISYDTLTKTFLKMLYLLPSDEKLSISIHYRELESKNLKNLMEIYVEEVLDKKFEKKEGIFKLEQRIWKDPNSIHNNHLIAYRMCRQAAMVVWIEQLKKAISLLLRSNDKYKEAEWSNKRIFWVEIANHEWEKIRNMIKVISQHKVWKYKENNEVLASLRSTRQSDWRDILLNGTLPGREKSFFPKLNDTKILNNALEMKR